jgi:hypothetical protein
MAHWLEVPELEERLQAIDDLPPSLTLLRECVGAIAAELEREILHEGQPPVITFRNHHGAFYNVSVHAEEYRVVYMHNAQIEFALTRTCELAWKICGYRCSPAEMRAARALAAQDGFTGEILPNEYFARAHRNRGR